MNVGRWAIVLGTPFFVLCGLTQSSIAWTIRGFQPLAAPPFHIPKTIHPNAIIPQDNPAFTTSGCSIDGTGSVFLNSQTVILFNDSNVSLSFQMEVQGVPAALTLKPGQLESITLSSGSKLVDPSGQIPGEVLAPGNGYKISPSGGKWLVSQM